MKRKFIIFTIIFSLLLGACALSACSKAAPDAVSELRGTFTYNETINQGLSVTNAAPGDIEVNNRQYLFANVYPINYGNEGMAIAYGIDQRLKLNRDFTYLYEYSILISNPRDWGGNSARLSVSITGTFEFAQGGSAGEYSVLLSDPTGGFQQVFGATITSPDSYGWSMHSQPDLSLDYGLLAKQENYRFDEYVRSRVVSVDKATRTLTDDVFYPEILNYIALYSTY